MDISEIDQFFLFEKAYLSIGPIATKSELDDGMRMKWNIL